MEISATIPDARFTITQSATTQASTPTVFSKLLDSTTQSIPQKAPESLSSDAPILRSLPASALASSVGTAHLLAADGLAQHEIVSLSKPSTLEFMQKAGTDAETALSVLYGVIGSNRDFRDWNAIMASATPLADARASTAALYSSDLPYARPNAYKPDQNQILAQSGLFAFVQLESSRPPVLSILDSNGNLLRQAGYDPASILKNIQEFGLAISELGNLAAQLDAQGIAYKPGALLPGSQLGTDFADLASGGLGTSYDWRYDALAAYKGPSVVAQLARNQQLAEEMGIGTGNTTATAIKEAAQAAITVSPSVAAITPVLQTQTAVQKAADSSYLLAADASVSAYKPTTLEFMAKTGVDAATANTTLYGVIGANKDYRDWGAIMATSDPLAAARASTAALYASNLPYAPADAYKPNQGQILAQSGPFAFVQMESSRPPVLSILDSNGNLLRQAGYDPASILKNIQEFGLAISELGNLAAQLDTQGIAYKPGALLPGSQLGTDFSDLASGGLGTSYDWRYDALAAYKGPSAVAQLARDQQLAQEMGIGVT